MVGVCGGGGVVEKGVVRGVVEKGSGGEGEWWGRGEVGNGRGGEGEW